MPKVSFRRREQLQARRVAVKVRWMEPCRGERMCRSFLLSLDRVRTSRESNQEMQRTGRAILRPVKGTNFDYACTTPPQIAF
jgi:hypothetical protein